MPSKHLPLKLSREEEVFLRHWMYDEAHYQEGTGQAKRLQREYKAIPADIAAVIAAAMPDPEEQWAAGVGPPPSEAPTWPWTEVELTARIGEARKWLTAHKGGD
jgi:hypothetical protein